MNFNLLTNIQQTRIKSILSAVVCNSSGGGGSFNKELLFPAGIKDSFGGTRINADFIAVGTAVIKNDGSEGGSYTLGTPIQWAFTSYEADCGQRLFSDIEGVINEGLNLYFPFPKSILGAWGIQNDEALNRSFASWGTHYLLNSPTSAIQITCYQPKPLSCFITGQAGNAHVGVSGDNSSLYEFGFNHSFWASYGLIGFNVLSGSADSPVIDYNQTIASYRGTATGLNNYSARLGGGFDQFNASVYLYNHTTNQIVTKAQWTTEDVIIISNQAIRALGVDLYLWRTENEFLKDVSSMSVLLMAELWFIGRALSSSSAELTWQAYPSASGYKIYRSINSDFSSHVLAYSGTALTFNDTGLSADTIYYYQMYATVSAVDYEITNYRVITNA